MKSHRPEVADALRSFETDYRERYLSTTEQIRQILTMVVIGGVVPLDLVPPPAEHWVDLVPLL